MSRAERRIVVLRGVLEAVFRRSFYTAGVLVSALALIQLYYAVLPGSYFLTAKDITVASVTAGSDVPFEWCRDPREGTIEATAVRTFYRLNTTTGAYESVADYKLPINVENIDEDCKPLRIQAARHPQREGVYYFVTDLTWKQNGYEKKLRFKSNRYTLIATVESLQQRVHELEEQIEDLQQRIQAFTASAPPMAAGHSPQITTTQASNTTTTNQPTTSGGSTPPARPNVLQQGAQAVVEGVNSAVIGLTGAVDKLVGN